MRYYVYFRGANGGVTGLSPVWTSLHSGRDGADKSGSAPSIVEIGGGWYYFDITLGTAPWDDTAGDLVGEIDGGSSLSDGARYLPIHITKRDLSSAKIAHKGVQGTDGSYTIYAQDDETPDFTVGMANASGVRTRTIEAAE